MGDTEPMETMVSNRCHPMKRLLEQIGEDGCGGAGGGVGDIHYRYLTSSIILTWITLIKEGGPWTRQACS